MLSIKSEFIKTLALINEESSSHSRPQSLRSFWPVVGVESSGFVQHRKSVIHGLPVKSSKSDWLTMRNEYSAHAQDIGSGQSSRSQPQTRRIVGSGDENVIIIVTTLKMISHRTAHSREFVCVFCFASC